jgi:hypothetical protein
VKIPEPIDVKGRLISFRPSEGSDIMYGEVVDVYFRRGADPRYPKGSQGYKNGIRALFKKISVLLADGRVLNMSAEQEDIKRLRMVAENQKEDYGW